MNQGLKKVSELPVGAIRAVFTDLDDTLTDEGRMSAPTYQALWDLKRQGYWLAIVSGRPAGWADCLMRLWPLDAMIFENGAGIVLREGKRLVVTNLARDTDRDEQRKVLQSLFERLRRDIPRLRLATDQPYRLFDYAIDFAEEPPGLDEREVEQVLTTLAADARVTAKLSSIHVNYWYGSHTKVTAAEWLLKGPLASLSISRDQTVFSGDSPNDEPLFAFFDHTVGVANIAKYLPRMKTPPRYVTEKPGGEGFREIAARLCQPRK
jgi:HAD superfamily hydrolase (TIGR01484 family)